MAVGGTSDVQESRVKSVCTSVNVTREILHYNWIEYSVITAIIISRGQDAVDAYYIELCPLGGDKILTIGWPGMYISHTGRLGDLEERRSMAK